MSVTAVLDVVNRRRYLAFSAVASGVLAGCTSVRGETPLASESEVEDTSAVIRFRDDGEEILRVQLQKQHRGEERRDYYPFWIATWQPEGVEVSSIRYEFRSPSYTSGFSPAGISLREDGHAKYATLSQDGDDPSTTVLDLPDVTEIGRGSVKVDLLLTDDPQQDPQELWIGAEAELSADGLLGSSYSATGDVTVEFP